MCGSCGQKYRGLRRPRPTPGAVPLRRDRRGRLIPKSVSVETPIPPPQPEPKKADE